jgi:tetratricopeptide (TPR) repeat protein
LRHAIVLGEQSLDAVRASGGYKRGIATVSLALALSCLLSEDVQAALTWAAKARAAFEEIYGTASADGHRYRAIVIFAQGLSHDPLQAAMRLQPVVARQRADDPKYLPRLLWYLGKLYLQAGRFNEAASALEEAERLLVAGEINQRHQLPVVRADLGLALLNVGKLDEAADKLQAALSGDGVPHTMTPAQANARVGLARLLLLRHEPRDALIHATAASDFWRDFDPQNPARKEAERVRSVAQRATAALAQH